MQSYRQAYMPIASLSVVYSSTARIQPFLALLHVSAILEVNVMLISVTSWVRTLIPAAHGYR
jgi:hypothetical protein